MKIANRSIGVNYEPLVIAEIGINHNGSIKEAFKLIDAAKKAGVEVIKHQTHIVQDEMSAEAKKIFPANSPDKSIYEIMEDCAISEKEEIELQQYVESKNMIFISTPFSRMAADRLMKMNVPAFKIGSGECNNLPLLEHVAKFKKPIIMSTGMNSIETIKPSVEILEKYNIKYCLLHTTNLYPTPYEFVRLGALNDLKKNFPNCEIGLSDHTDNNFSCYGAIALGATVLEKHFTDNRSRSGPDISSSMDSEMCMELIKASKILFKQRGGKKNIIKEEKVTSDFAFATVVSIKDIESGEKFSKENIWVKRPGTGEIHASQYSEILGKTCKNKITIDQHIKKEDIS